MYALLAEKLLLSVRMLSEASDRAGVGVTSERVRLAIGTRYGASRAGVYGISLERFLQIAGAVVERYATDASEAEQSALIAGLHVADLVLARACADGNEAAWTEFLTRFRVPLYEAAYRIAKNEATGRELADALYADLYGMPNSEGRRVCRLDYYMGRGSLEGWLRTVLAQQYVNQYRARSREVSLDEQLDAGASFAAKEPASTGPTESVIGVAIAQALADLNADERFLLASWFLDRRTLAEIGRQLGVHESTVSRRLDRITGTLRKRVRKRLQAAGRSARECEELMQELDVRDLTVNATAALKQESRLESFNK